MQPLDLRFFGSLRCRRQLLEQIDEAVGTLISWQIALNTADGREIGRRKEPPLRILSHPHTCAPTKGPYSIHTNPSPLSCSVLPLDTVFGIGSTLKVLQLRMFRIGMTPSDITIQPKVKIKPCITRFLNAACVSSVNLLCSSDDMGAKGLPNCLAGICRASPLMIVSCLSRN